MEAIPANSRKRRSLKSSSNGSLTAQDKDWLKEKCLQRVRQERGKLIARLRQEKMGFNCSRSTAASPNHENIYKFNVRDTAKDILDRGLKSLDFRTIASGEGHDSNSDDTSQMNERIKWNCDAEDSNVMICDADYINMMCYLQEALEAEIAEAEQEYEISLKEESDRLEMEVDKMDTDLQYADYEEEVLCPVCKCSWLKQQGDNITCTCGLRLSGNDRNHQLPYLREKLASIFSEHRLKCPNPPRFRICDKFGGQLLRSQCDLCAFDKFIM